MLPLIVIPTSLGYIPHISDIQNNRKAQPNQVKQFIFKI